MDYREYWAPEARAIYEKIYEKPVPNRYKYNEDWIRSKIPDELRKDIPTVRSKKQAEMFFSS